MQFRPRNHLAPNQVSMQQGSKKVENFPQDTSIDYIATTPSLSEVKLIIQKRIT